MSGSHTKTRTVRPAPASVVGRPPSPHWSPNQHASPARLGPRLYVSTLAFVCRLSHQGRDTRSVCSERGAGREDDTCEMRRTLHQQSLLSRPPALGRVFGGSDPGWQSGSSQLTNASYARMSTIHQTLDKQLASLDHAGAERIWTEQASSGDRSAAVLPCSPCAVRNCPDGRPIRSPS